MRKITFLFVALTIVFIGCERPVDDTDTDTKDSPYPLYVPSGDTTGEVAVSGGGAPGEIVVTKWVCTDVRYEGVSTTPDNEDLKGVSVGVDTSLDYKITLSEGSDVITSEGAYSMEITTDIKLSGFPFGTVKNDLLDQKLFETGTWSISEKEYDGKTIKIVTIISGVETVEAQIVSVTDTYLELRARETDFVFDYNDMEINSDLVVTMKFTKVIE